MPLKQRVWDVLADIMLTPFVALSELAVMGGYKTHTLNRDADKLRELGYVSVLEHAAAERQPKKRIFVTKQGLLAVCDEFSASLDELYEEYPCSSEWQRSLFKKIDSLSILYTLAVRVAQCRPASIPLEVSIPRKGSIDMFIKGADGICIGVMRKGNALPTREFQKRFWAIAHGNGEMEWQHKGPPLTLVITPTSFEKKWTHQRLLEREFDSRMMCLFATEREALEMPVDAEVCTLSDASGTQMALADLLDVLQVDDEYEIPKQSIEKHHPPVDCSKLKGAAITPIQQRAINCLMDWPLLTKPEMGALLGWTNTTLTYGRVPRMLREMIADGCLIEVGEKRNKRLALGDEGLRWISQRDRTALHRLRSKWGHNGSQMKKLIKELPHTTGINKFVARMMQESEDRIEALPDHAITRYYRTSELIRDTKRVSADAALLMRVSGDLQTVLLEYEVRASRGGQPMRDKLSVWMDYYLTNIEVKNWQFVGNVQQQENPFELDNEITLFIVPTESVRQNFMRYVQDILIEIQWQQGMSRLFPIAIGVEPELDACRSILTDEVWLRVDDFEQKRCNPILSRKRRASPRALRRR